MSADSMLISDEFSIRIRQRGQLTLPKKVRDALSIEAGDVLTLLQIGEAIMLSPRPFRGVELGDKFIELMAEEGVTLAELLEDLPKIREEIYHEKYESKAA